MLKLFFTITYTHIKEKKTQTCAPIKGNTVASLHFILSIAHDNKQEAWHPYNHSEQTHRAYSTSSRSKMLEAKLSAVCTIITKG